MLLKPNDFKNLLAWIDRIRTIPNLPQDLDILFVKLQFIKIGQIRILMQDAYLDGLAGSEYGLLFFGINPGFATYSHIENFWRENKPIEIARIVRHAHDKFDSLNMTKTLIEKLLPDEAELHSWKKQNEAIEAACAIIKKYTSIFKFSIFGHHHNARAKAIIETLKTKGNLREIIFILENQKYILEGKAASNQFLSLPERWSVSAFLKNTRPYQDLEHSTYYQAIKAALVKIQEVNKLNLVRERPFTIV